ncbi:LPS assembly protein LptD [Pseudoalteromonas sp. T1lg22]|uniref:LPS assembly protein LptD n=1 Tax=Pseudoalteromonas sp. T1lg22 TaxID=2077096 RepID=UPI001F42B2D2|nr:LPS assembly protein LptD [Pseudoalteromonas sp. T1lg22]
MNKLWGMIAIALYGTQASVALAAVEQATDAKVPAPEGEAFIAPAPEPGEIPHCFAAVRPAPWQAPDLPFGVIEIVADDVELIGQASAQFDGDVDISSSTMTLNARSALIDKQQGLLNAQGPLTYRDGVAIITSRGLNASLDDSNIKLLAADYQLTEQQGRGGAEQLEVSQEALTLSNASFTTCPVDDETWSINADKIILSQQKGWGETHGATLKIYNTPVLYLPYFTFPINDQRKTGFLAPRLSSSNRYGVETITPYYINLAPNYDLTLTPRYMSKKGLQLQSEFRYLTETSQGMLGLEYLDSDKTERELGNRYIYHWQQQSYFNDQWRAGVDITNVSDDNYLTDLGSNYASKTDTHLARSGILTHLGERWRTDIQIQDYEVLGDHLESYTALPRIGFSQTQAYQLGWFDASINGEISHFRNSTRIIDEATRLHIEPKLSFSEDRYAWSFLSEFSLLHTYYDQQGDLADTDFEETVHRTLPKVRLYSQLNFERDTSLFVDNGIQTLEPQIQYLYTPNKDQNNIGLFDTTKLQDDFFGLFRDRRFSGVDRIAAANQITLGATTRVFDGKNEEVFNLSAGQIFYLSDSAKPTAQDFADDTSYDSLFASEAMWHWHRRWYLSGGIQYDIDGSQMIQSHLTLDYKGDDNELMQLNHRYANDVSGNTIEQVGMFTSVPIDDNWQFVASYHRDLDAGRSIEVYTGVQYESCCWAVQVTGHRQIETDLNQSINQEQAVFDSGIGIKFVLKGLGGKSSYDAQEILKEGIFGYRRPYFLTK